MYSTIPPQVKDLSVLEGPLIFSAGINLPPNHPLRPHHRKSVKILGRDLTYGGWLVEVCDTPEIKFSAHREQLRHWRIPPQLGDYL